MINPRKSLIEAATDALATYLQTALGSDVKVSGNWPEPDKQLRKSVTILSIGSRQVEIDATYAKVLATAETTPPDPAGVLKSYTWSVGIFRQSVQLDIWATSRVACDDLLARLDESLRAGLGATLGHANADPFRDGCLVKLAPADGYPENFADFVFDGQEDDQTPAKAGHDEWRATMRGECSVNYTVTKTLPRLKSIRIKLRTVESSDPFETDVFTMNDDGTVTHTVTVP